jgi:hypothetical protein
MRCAAFVVALLVGGLAARAADTAWLLVYFTRNGQDGLHLAWSADGFAWEVLNGGRSVLAPRVGAKEKLMRDPCVLRGPDGTYHLVWTSGWWERGIGYAATRDFRTWSEQRDLPVMAHEPTARNAWAPELAFDEARGEFSIFWATTIPGRFANADGSLSEDQLNHRIYRATTRDFRTLGPTELFYDPGFSCIDATFLVDGARRWLLIKDETRFPAPAKHLRVARAESVAGPFAPLGEPITPPGVWAEGPTAVKIGEHYVVYFDAYRDRHYAALRSRDLVTWEDVTAQLKMPFEGTSARPRHGTIIAVPRALIDSLRKAEFPDAPRN